MPANHRDRRSAFTLMEIIIVLALLVAVAAMAAPIYQTTVQQQRLRKAAEDIRADWVRTRVEAIQSGETQLWTCLTEDGSYWAAPFVSDALTSGQAGAAGGAGVPVGGAGASAGAANQSAGATASQPLPEGISVGSVVVSEANTVLEMNQFANGGDTGQVDVYFYPDGTSSSVRLTLLRENDDAEPEQAIVTLHGLSGTTRLLRKAAE